MQGAPQPESSKNHVGTGLGMSGRRLPNRAGTLFYSTVLAIEQIAHRFPASSIGSFVALPSVAGVAASIGSLFFAALRTVIRKPGFPRLQFEFFPTDRARFDRKCHNKVMIIEAARALLPRLPPREIAEAPCFRGSPKDETGRIFVTIA